VAAGLDGEPAAAVDDDDVPHPAASTPAASSGTASNVFFMTTPTGKDERSAIFWPYCPLMTPQGPPRLGRRCRP
jgi:hypothetical protein